MANDLGKLKSTAERTVAKKEEHVDAHVKTQADMRGITELSRGIAPLTKDEAMVRKIEEGLRNARALDSKNTMGIQKADLELFDIKDELLAIRGSASATQDRARAANMRRVNRAQIDEIGREQAQTIDKVDHILRFMGSADEKFKTMLRMTVHYHNIAERISQTDFRGNDVKDFTGHTLQHTLEVRSKMHDFRKVMNCIGSGDEKFFSLDTMDAAAAFHDTGMDGNASYINTLFLKAFPERVEDLRKRHSLESGIRLLAHRDKLAPMGVDVDQAAFVITLHSKTGYLEGGKERDLNEITYDEDGKRNKEKFAGIKQAADNFARECKARSNIDWDMTWLCKDGKWDDEALQKVANSASLLRLSDASRDRDKQYAQNGARYVFTNADQCAGRSARVEVNENGKINKKTMHREIEGMGIAYDYGDEVGNDVSRAIVFGEHNIKSMDLWPTEDGGLVYRFVVDNPDVGPGCTAYVIQERIDEIKSAIFSRIPGKIEVMSDNGRVSEITKYLRLPDGWSAVFA